MVVVWRLQIDSESFVVKLVHGHITGKKTIYLNGKEVHSVISVLDSGIVFELPEPAGGCALTVHIEENISGTTRNIADPGFNPFSGEGDWLYDLEVAGSRLAEVLRQRLENRNSDGIEMH
jgi:hypothetical protein